MLRKNITVGAVLALLLSVSSHAFGYINTAPIANAGGPYTMHLGDSLTLDGGASADANIPSGDFISFYRWDLNNDGIFDVGSANAVQAYSSSVLNGLGLNHVGDYTIRLQVIDTNGAPNIAKTDLAILAAVPEPESYAMLLAGLGLIGCMARRRNAPRKLI